MHKFTRVTFKILDLFVILIMTFGAPMSVLAANPAADLDQCANDPLPSSHTDGCDTNANQWVNGNLGASKSVYLEGDSIPYRLKFSNLSLASHTVVIEWDTTKSGKHALDYITTFNQTVTTANPCLGISGCGSPTTFPIPDDPQVTGGGVTPIAGNFTMYGGTITGVSTYSYPNGTGFAGDKSAQLTITFTASVANPVLAWGGHIATRADWGAGNSAVSISGSPYHTRLIDLDGSGGNQDRSLSAEAVIFPASITIVKDAVPDDAQDFSFTSTGGLTPSSFTLDDDPNSSPPSNTQSYTGIINFTTYTFTEAAVSGWTLSFGTPVCTVPVPNGGSQSGNVGTRTLTINLAEGEDVTCTFTNTRQAATLIVIKHVINDNGGTAVASDFTMSVTGSSPNPSSFPGAESPGTSVTLSPGSYSVSESSVAGYTSDGGSADCSGTIAAGQTKTCTFTNDDIATPHLSITKEATESGFSAVGDVIHYTIVATNDGNTTLAAVTVTDAQVSDLTCTPANGSPLAPGASMTCTASHTVTQADIDAGSFYNQACVDDGADGAAQACDDVTTPGTQNPHLSITKEATESGFSAVGDVIHYTITATNDGNVTLHNVDVTDSQVSDLSCSPTTPVTDLAVGASITCTASHTVTQADIDAGSFYNQACVDDGDGGAAQACDDVTTPGSQNPHLSITKVATEDGFSAVGDVIHYTIVATNDGNTTLQSVTVTDAQVSNLDCTPANGSSLAPGDSMTCTASHTITQADLDAGSFYNQACVDDGASGAAQACDDVTTPAAPRLIVIKHVINDNGGTKTAADFTMTVDDPGTNPPSFAGAESPGTIVVVDPGAYSVSETGPSGYSASYSADCTGTIAVGETKTCTVTNDDQPGTLIVKKVVINDNEGTKTCADFSFSVNGGASTPFEADCQNDLTVDAGTYNVTEPAVSGYTTTYNNCSNVAVPNGGSATCTITNDDIAPPVVAQITPTQTTCNQFASGTAPTLSQLQYAVKGGKTSAVAPGVFFYWVKVTAVAGSNTFTINQAITTGNFDSHFFKQASGSFAYTSGCTKINATISTSNGVTTVTFNASSAGTYIIGIKYDSKSVEGFAAPSPDTTVHYSFSTAGVPGSTQGLDLKKK